MQIVYARLALVVSFSLAVLTAPAASQPGAALNAAVANISSVSDVKTFLLHHIDLNPTQIPIVPPLVTPSPPPPPPPAPPAPTKVYVTGSVLRMSMCTLVDQELLCGVGLIDVPASNIALSPDGKTAYTTFVSGPRFGLLPVKKQDVQNASALATARLRGPGLRGPGYLKLVHVCPIVSDYTIACGPPTGSNFDFPADIAISPDGKTAYVINLYGNETGSVTVCEIQGLNLNCSQPTGIGSLFYPTSIALSPNGSIAYVLNAANGLITACKVSGDVFENCQANDINSGGVYGIALSPDGMTMYVSTTNSSLGGITICNVSDYMVGPCTSELNPDGVFNNPGFISLSKDGSQLFAAESGKRFAHAASPSSGRVVSCLVDGETLLSCSNSTIIYAGKDVVGVAAY